MEEVVREGKPQLIALLLLLLFLAGGCSRPEVTGDGSLHYGLPQEVEDHILRLSATGDAVTLEQKLSATYPPSEAAFWTGVVAASAGDTAVAQSCMTRALVAGVRGDKELVARMIIADCALARGDASGAVQAYEELLPEQNGHLRFLILARIVASKHFANDSDGAATAFYDWQNQFPHLASGFVSAAAVAARFREDLSPVEEYALQAGYFTDRELAQASAVRIRALGFNVEVRSSGSGYRVLVGPFKGRPAALDAANKLRAGGFDSFLKPWSES